VVDASFDDDNVDAVQRQLANRIRPVGPAPAIATAWSFIVTLLSATVRHPSRARPFRVFISRSAILRHDQGVAASPPVRGTLRVAGSGYRPLPFSLCISSCAAWPK
jgi:hypothetical protein